MNHLKDSFYDKWSCEKIGNMDSSKKKKSVNLEMKESPSADYETSIEKFDIKIKHIVEDGALNSKAHGLSNIVRNPKLFLKIIWTLGFLACGGYCK